MNKNKRGWGLTSELLFILIFIICIIIALLGLKKINLVGGITPSNKPEPYNYTLLEQNLVKSAKQYISKEYNNKLGIDTLIIKANLLVKNNMLTNYVDEEKNLCSGYVEVFLNENNEIIYMPYVKCGKHYETKGYVERKDNNE